VNSQPQTISEPAHTPAEPRQQEAALDDRCSRSAASAGALGTACQDGRDDQSPKFDSPPQATELGQGEPDNTAPASGGSAESRPSQLHEADQPQAEAPPVEGDAAAPILRAGAKESADEPQREAQGGGEPAEARDESAEEPQVAKDWYILKVQVNREESIRDALVRRVKIAGLEPFFGDIIVPTEDVAEFNKNGKRRIVKRKLYPGYVMVHMAINDDTWFLVRETPGIGDFTGSAGRPTPMAPHEVARILNASKDVEGGESPVKTAIPFKGGDRVRVREGYFQNFEGEIESVDEANGRVTVMINIFGRSTPVELEHWQIEFV
jgi:transcriptional antiterminator NusG